jgi:predicted regulator of Ras-like GTPase activity (Roadblock/LC7/MglB family)
MTGTNELGWLVDDLVARVGDIDKAIILTRHGLSIGASAGLSQEEAEHFAAVAASFQSLAQGAGRHFECGQVRQTIVEMEYGYMFVTAAGEGSCLAVLTASSADVGLVAYEMVTLVRRVGEHLSVPSRRAPLNARPM